MTDMNSKNFTINYSRDTSLRELVAPLFRRKGLLIATFLSILGIVILAGLLVPPSYKSQMAVLVNRERLDPLVTTEATTQMNSNAANPVTVEEINSEAELILSQDVLKKVVIATGLNSKQSSLDWFFPKKSEEERAERAVKGLAKQLKIKNATNSNLINISYSSTDPQLSYAVLNSLGKFYVEKHVEVHRPPGSFQFFAKETQKYHDALQNSEQNLKSFSHREGVAAPDIERTDLAITIATSIGQLHTAEQAVAADEERIRSDEAHLKQTPQRLPTQEASNPADKLLEELGASLLAAQTKRSQLALKYDPSYPLVQEADQEIDQTKAAIVEAEKTRYVTQNTDVDPTYELLREDLAKTEADRAAQTATATAAKHSIESMQTQMVNLDQQALTQQDLLREEKANEDNYLLYLGKREQERTSDALDNTRIANVAIAVPPAIPVLPVYSFRMVILVAFGLAILMSIGTAYTFDYFDSSFHTPAQVIEMMGIPVVIAVSKKTA
ncbi:MAG: GumC family protein [Terracidiphilus sp.]